MSNSCLCVNTGLYYLYPEHQLWKQKKKKWHGPPLSYFLIVSNEENMPIMEQDCAFKKTKKKKQKQKKKKKNAKTGIFG